MRKVYKIPVTLHIRAIDEETALAMASLHCFHATHAIQEYNGSWVQDNVTMFQPPNAPDGWSYDKKILKKVFGEKRAIKMLEGSLRMHY